MDPNSPTKITPKKSDQPRLHSYNAVLKKLEHYSEEDKNALKPMHDVITSTSRRIRQLVKASNERDFALVYYKAMYGMMQVKHALERNIEVLNRYIAVYNEKYKTTLQPVEAVTNEDGWIVLDEKVQKQLDMFNEEYYNTYSCGRWVMEIRNLIRRGVNIDFVRYITDALPPCLSNLPELTQFLNSNVPGWQVPAEEREVPLKRARRLFEPPSPEDHEENLRTVIQYTSAFLEDDDSDPENVLCHENLCSDEFPNHVQSPIPFDMTRHDNDSDALSEVDLLILSDIISDNL